jgi:fructose-1-phosphate kinase PfkB-like protein
MIYTVTLNPALDRAINIDRLLDDDTIRVISKKNYAAAKGPDVDPVEIDQFYNHILSIADMDYMVLSRRFYGCRFYSCPFRG